MSFQHPLQKLFAIPSAAGYSKVLFAATGAYISSFGLPHGHLLSRWPRDNDDDEFSDSDAVHGDDSNDGEPPKKRQRIEDSRASSEESVEIVSERVKGQRRKAKIVVSKLPNVSHLFATLDGKHVIAVTVEDKCIRVFEVRGAGRLRTLSERCMPKRLCAITLTPDEDTIIAGDKFGDVYSLPLFISAEAAQKPKGTPQELSTEFKPSATELTVHTRGNLEALRQQREQKQLKPKKEGPSFEHQLLLGHVSLLTDVTVAQIPVGGRLRPHILTSDRDEHIRISRGIPQAHIIENYCSGHKEFVSKLCALPWNPSILVAGSGESSLKVYHCPDGSLTYETAFGGLVKEELSQRSALPIADVEGLTHRLAVSGIWPIDVSGWKNAASKENDGLVLVALEGLPILLSYLTTDDGKLVHHQTIHLPGNALDVTVIHGAQTKNLATLVSVDTVHRPGSCREYRAEEFQTSPPLAAFCLVSSDGNGESTNPVFPYRWADSEIAAPLNEVITSSTSAAAVYEPSAVSETGRASHISARYSPLGEFLYGLENLRKKRGAEAVEEERDDDDGEDQREGAILPSPAAAATGAAEAEAQ